MSRAGRPLLAAEPAPEPPQVARLRVLVVDDNQDSTESLAALLKMWGHEAETAAGRIGGGARVPPRSGGGGDRAGRPDGLGPGVGSAASRSRGLRFPSHEAGELRDPAHDPRRRGARRTR